MGLSKTDLEFIEDNARAVTLAAWRSDIDYTTVPSYCTGSDGTLYVSTQASGPNNGGAQDPTSTTGFWEILFEGFATNAEVIAGTETTLIVTPAGLAALTSEFDRRGLIELASPGETRDGLDNERAVSPSTYLDAINNNGQIRTDLINLVRSNDAASSTTQLGSVELSTDAEAIDGANFSVVITPGTLRNSINNSGTIRNALVSLVRSLDATTEETGVVELATDVETRAGTATTRVITPNNLASAINTSGAVQNLLRLHVGVGAGQTWQAVSRAFNTTYTNTTGRSIGVAFTIQAPVGALLETGLTVGGRVISRFSFDNEAGLVGRVTHSAIIPDNTTYRVTGTGQSNSFVSAEELR